MENVCKTVTASLEATTISNEQKQIARQLEQQARRVIRDRALSLANSVPFVKGNKMVAEWHDNHGRYHQVFVGASDSVWSSVYMGERPSGRAHATHRLLSVPVAHLEEHFGPLMKPDYAIPKDSDGKFLLQSDDDIRKLAELVVAKAQEMAIDADTDSFHTGSTPSHAVSGKVLRRTDPVDGDQPDGGAALVFASDRSCGRDNQHFWLVSLRHPKNRLRTIWSPAAEKITQLKLSNPSHLQLLWDVIGNA